MFISHFRGTSKLESSVKVLRSSSFLQKAREAQERDRNRLGLQDDSIVPSPTKPVIYLSGKFTL
jgi:hypothetical protein